MPVSAWIVLISASLILFGGLTLCIVAAVKGKKENHEA